MRTMLHRRFRRLNDQDGAYVVEFLGSIVALLAFILVIVQTAIVFVNASLVNHALGLAAQEAAARGAVDDNVQMAFQEHLPRAIRDQGSPLMCEPVGCQAGGNITPGFEPTSSGQMMTLSYDYVQDFGLLRIIGLDVGVNVHRSVKVTSQSTKE